MNESDDKDECSETEVYENEGRRIQWRWRCLHVTLKAIILFVVQPAGSAPLSYGSAQTGNVSTRIMCATAQTTVATVLTKQTAVSWCLWQWCWWWWCNSSSVSLWCWKYMCLFWFPDFAMLKMVCVLIVQLPIHVTNGAPEQTIHRKSEGDNKNERKRWRSMAVIMLMSGFTMEVIGCDDNVACNWREKWIKLTLIVGSHDRKSCNFPTKCITTRRLHLGQRRRYR